MQQSRISVWSSALVALVLGLGCDAAPGPLGRDDAGGGGGPDAGFDAAAPAEDGGSEPTGCDDADTDGDGIADAREGDGDPDGDGLPNAADDDSDGDGISDADEARSTDPCAPADSDGDGTPDFIDTDSDNDGLSDEREAELGTDPTDTDSDDDGVTDLGEVDGAGTDPNDAGSTIPEGDFFVVLPYEGDREERRLRFGTDIEIADVFMLVDMTGSMGGERQNLITGLLDVIIPGIQAEIPDVQFGVGGFDDYPYAGYGSDCEVRTLAGTGTGPRCDTPFYLLREIGPPDRDVGGWSLSASATECPIDTSVRNIGRIEGSPNGRPDLLEAVEGLPCHYGADGPESYVPALWSTATGMGLSWPTGSIPGQTCPVIPDEDGTRVGYPCFRPGALPIVLFFGDNEFHNGPGGSEAYSFDAPTYTEAVDALNDIGARVIGVDSGSARPEFEQVATATGAVRADGTPLVFDIASDGTGLDSTVVSAVAELVGGTPQDVTTRTENVPGNPDDFDATAFIEAIVPFEGYTPSGGPGGYGSKDATTFYEVIPGTTVEFTIDFYNGVRMPADVAQIFQARIIVVGNDVTDLDARNVYIVVPPEGGTVLI
jgi:hypothetical protein